MGGTCDLFSPLGLGVEFLLKTDSGYPRDAEITLFTLATPGSSLFFLDSDFVLFTIYISFASSRNRRVPEIWEVTKTGVVEDFGKKLKKKIGKRKKKKFPVSKNNPNDIWRAASGAWRLRGCSSFACRAPEGLSFPPLVVPC